MRRTLGALLFACWIGAALAQETGTFIRGTVQTEGGDPGAGAAVQALRLPSGPAYSALARHDGAFEIAVPGPGSYVLFAVMAGADMRRADPVEVGAEGLDGVVLTVPAVVSPGAGPAGAAGAAVPTAGAPAGGFWSSPLGNPIVATVAQRPLSRRAASVLAAVLGAVSTVVVVLLLLRSQKMQRRELSAQETASLVMNDNRRGLDRLQAYGVGARGVEFTMSVDADKMREFLDARRYDLVLAWIVLMTLVSVSVLGFGTAMMIGQPRWLMLCVAFITAVFLLAPWILIYLARRGQASSSSPIRPA